MDRREFFKLMGTTSIGVIGLGCRNQYQEFFDLKEDLRSEILISDEYIRTICQLCNAGCALEARVVNGNVTQIKGNPFSPLNRGRICLRGAAAAQHLYNSHRIKNPLILKGKKGSGDYQEIEWDEALAMITERLGQLRGRGEPQKVAMISGHQRGLIDRLFSNFFSAYGSPNYMKILPDAGIRSVLKLMHGEEGSIGYDLENANYILNFAVNLFEASASPVWNNWVYGYLNREREGRRAKLVYIDSIGNITAYKSDEWIKINPCTTGALALGIAHVLVRRNLYNSDFVRSNTFGFEDWTDSNGVMHKGFKTLLLEEYDPGIVSKLSHVSIRDIERLAREFAENQPGIAIFDDTIAQEPGSVYSQMAVHTLNALMGNINMPGGIFMQQDILYSEFPAPGKDTAAINGLAHQRVDLAQTAQYPLAESVIQNLLQDQANDAIDILFLYNCNPLYTLSEGERYKDFLRSIPFVVNFSSFFDETTQYSDLLLPEPTFLEKWQDVPAGTQTGFNQILGIMKPVLPPLYNTRPAGDIFLSLAGALGSPLSEALPWDTFENLLKDCLHGVFDSKSGMIFSGAYDKSWVESLEKSGWRYTTYRTFDEFWEQIVESGGWWNPVFPQTNSRPLYKTPSGKFEFFSQTLLKRIAETDPPEVDSRRMNDETFMPHFEPPQFLGNVSDYLLVLFPFETGALRNGAVNTQPSLLGVMNPIDSEKWESWAEINHSTAEKFNFHHNDIVRIESPFGEFITKLKISNRVVPGVIGIPVGLGHNDLDSSGKQIGVNPNSILGVNVDWISGIETKRGTRVNVYRI